MDKFVQKFDNLSKEICTLKTGEGWTNLSKVGQFVEMSKYSKDWGRMDEFVEKH